jgi:hypothetical protein
MITNIFYVIPFVTTKKIPTEIKHKKEVGIETY